MDRSLGEPPPFVVVVQGPPQVKAGGYSSWIHGFPKVMGVLTHLDSKFKDPKKLRKTKQRLKHRFWAEIKEGAKLFYLSGLDNGK
nr:unnamed protein product [Digitaria exilis]